MAKDIEIVSISSQLTTVNSLPVGMSTTNLVSNVIGSSADTGLTYSLAGAMRRTQAAWLTTAGSTYILSTAAVITGMTFVPTSSGAGAASLSDGTTVILSIPAASYIPDPRPHYISFGQHGIRNTAAAGFKVILGASMSVLVQGAFGVVTTA
jgi:hypothetical protein